MVYSHCCDYNFGHFPLTQAKGTHNPPSDGMEQEENTLS